MTTFPSNAITIHNHAIDTVIVNHFGLSSVMDIDTVKLEFKRYEVILENGDRKIISKHAVDQALATQAQLDDLCDDDSADEVYTIKSIGRGFNGMYFVELQDGFGNDSRIIQRRISFIFQEGTRVYIGQNRQLQLAD